jgi:hypothetical protein
MATAAAAAAAAVVAAAAARYLSCLSGVPFLWGLLLLAIFVSL